MLSVSRFVILQDYHATNRSFHQTVEITGTFTSLVFKSTTPMCELCGSHTGEWEVLWRTPVLQLRLGKCLLIPAKLPGSVLVHIAPLTNQLFRRRVVDI